MADQQITQLPEELGTVASTFPLAIVNVTAAETRKITTANLATAIFANLSTGGLDAAKVGSGIDGSKLVNDSVSNAKLDNSSVSFGGVNLSLGGQDSTPSFNLQDATDYPASALTGTITNAQLAGSIAVSKLASSSVSFGGISVNLGSAIAKPAFDLENATAYKTTNLVGTITNAQLAGSIENAKLSNSSVSFGGIALNLGQSDPHPAFDLQDATEYKTTNLVGTITNAQLAGSIEATKLVANSLTTDQLGPNCVGSSELADNSVDTGALQDGKITNSKIETSSSSTTGIDGATKLRDGTVTASKLNASTVGNGLAINSNVLSINNAITGATSLGLTFSNQGICTGITAIQASDLSGVLATASAVGVVKVPSSGGLSVSGSGDLSLASTVTAHTTRGIAVNAFGQVTSVSATVPSASLPLSSTIAVGGIKVPATSSPLAVDSAGILSLGVSGVTAGTGFTKFNVSDKGLILSASGLDANDIPNISAAKLTSGTIDAGRIGQIISGAKLTDSSTTVFGGPGSTSNITTFPSAGDFKGQRFWDEYNSDEYIWTGSSWTPVTITAGELVFLGLYSASDNTVSSVTTSGAAAGLTANNALPSASNTNKRGYVVVDDTGTGSGNAPAVTLNAPDYLLSDGTAWKHVDVSSAIAATSANQVSVSATGDDITNNVQASLENLQTNKIRKTGGEMSGLLRITATGSLAFEGSSEDAFETILNTVNPTDSDKTILLPNISGTLITTSDQNTVTSTMVDASLANANIAANAAIALSKLAAVSAGQILVGAASTGTITAVTVSGDIALSSAGAFSYVAGSISNSDINASAGISSSKIDAASTSQAGCVQLSSAVNSTSTSLASTASATKSAYDLANTANTGLSNKLNLSGGVLSGNITLDNQKELQFREADAGGDHYIALKAAAALAADVTLTLPNNSPSAGFVLKAGSSTPTNLEWAADATNTAAADLTGSTLASGVTASSLTSLGTLTGLTVDGEIDIADGEYLDFGNGNLRIRSNANSAYIIENDTGKLAIQASNLELANTAGTKNYLYATDGGSVALYHDNVKTFETTSDGITVLGPEGGNAFISFEADEGDDDSDKFDIGVYQGGPFKIQNKKSGSWEDNVVITGDGAVELYHDNSIRLETISTGAKVHGANLQLVNTASSGDAQLFLQAGEGASAYITLYADDGDNQSDKWKIIAPDGGSFAIQYDDGNWENALTATKDGAVTLFHDNSARLATSAAGVTVTGTVSDSKGELRTIPQLSKSASHVIVAGDAGQHSINSSGGWTINTSTGFTAGQAITLINNSSGDQTITSTGVTLYNSADGSTPTKIATRGMATVICTASNTYYISGAGLS